MRNLVWLALFAAGPALAQDAVGPRLAKVPAWPKTVDAAAACEKQVKAQKADLQRDTIAMAQRGMGSNMSFNTTSPAYAQAMQLMSEAMECRPTLGNWLVGAIPDSRDPFEARLQPLDAERGHALTKCVKQHGEGSDIDAVCKKRVDAQFNARAKGVAEAWLPEPGRKYAAAYERTQACIAKGDAARAAAAKAGLANSPFFTAIEPGLELGFTGILLQRLGEHCSLAAATANRYHD